MQEYQHRVIEEKAALDEKIFRLEGALTSGRLDSVPDDEKGLLARQLLAMEEYSGILDERMARFT